MPASEKIAIGQLILVRRQESNPLAKGPVFTGLIPVQNNNGYSNGYTGTNRCTRWALTVRVLARGDGKACHPVTSRQAPSSPLYAR